MDILQYTLQELAKETNRFTSVTDEPLICLIRQTITLVSTTTIHKHQFQL